MKTFHLLPDLEFLGMDFQNILCQSSSPGDSEAHQFEDQQHE